MNSETEIREMIAKYLTAEKEVLEGKQVTFGGRTLTMESLPELIKGREKWEVRLRQLSPGGSAPALATFG